MKSIYTLIICSAFLTGSALAETITFDDVKTGGPPPGWTATQTGSGSAKWSVEKDDSAPSKPNVLKQSGVATFPVCFQERHQSEGRIRGSEVQTGQRQRGPSWRGHLAGKSCEQLLHRARERARGQRGPLQDCKRQAQFA